MQNRVILFFLMGIFCVCIATNACAQNMGAAQKLYDKAINALDNKSYNEGINLLNASLKKDSNFVDSYISLFQAYLELKQKKNAIDAFEKAIPKDSLSCLPYFVKYANAYASLGNYHKAAIILNSIAANLPSYLRPSFNQLNTVCTFAAAHPADANVKVINAGDNINSADAEYFPTVTVQDSLLIFMRRNGISREDFFFSTMTPSGLTKAQPLSDNLNITDKKGAPSLSSDLQTLYFSAEYPSAGFGRYDIYSVAKTDSGWASPINLGPNINSDWWESAPSISPDGSALYFCSNKPGGYGGIDIYVAYKNKKGGWNKAINLGPTINTPGDEQTPFIHADNNSLYFASNGWPGYGGSDLFVSHKKLNGSWSKPINLGAPINTNDNEASVAISSNGIDGYMASDRPDSKGNLDIYKINLPESVRANKTYYFNGLIRDAITWNTLSGSVKLSDNNDSSKFMMVNVDNSGKFVLALPYFDSLGIQINSPNHDYVSLLLDKEKLAELNSKTFEFVLNPIQKQFSKNFNNVFFEVNSATLLTKSNVELNALITYLQSTVNATILIEGYTDNTGNATSNMILSSKRAESIAQFLINKGIDKNRITTKGFGDSKPIADNTTEQGRARNRRTSFTITIP
jgi:outer membrane protein OmpA-like peptidoglycan-associated protein/tetratricopeptide (TPR) repeat protein